MKLQKDLIAYCLVTNLDKVRIVFTLSEYAQQELNQKLKQVFSVAYTFIFQSSHLRVDYRSEASKKALLWDRKNTGDLQALFREDNLISNIQSVSQKINSLPAYINNRLFTFWAATLKFHMLKNTWKKV